jgi:carbamoyltransferase
MKVLGIGGSIHDFAACILEDGEIIIAIEDERITRIKHSLDLDVERSGCQAVEYCLRHTGLTLDDMDLIVVNDAVLPEYYRTFADRVTIVLHHDTHAASCYYPSPFEEAAILVVDGAGGLIDGFHETVSYYYGKQNEMNEIHKVLGQMNTSDEKYAPIVENSMGYFYDLLSNGIGFYRLTSGKTMGLAPYGTKLFVNAFKDFYTMDDEGRFEQSAEHIELMKRFIRQKLTTAIRNREDVFQTKADIAYAGQYHLEQMMVKAANYLHRQTGSKNLCLAGGVALNSVANYRILEETPFERIFIQPAAGDGGTALGAASYGYHQLKGQPMPKEKKLFSPYLGKRYGADEISAALQEFDGFEIYKPDDLYKEVAGLLANGSIIGWFQGRSEIGPRALGNRSILADPRKAEMKDIINARIKHREAFRPFAPIVMEERQGDYFSMTHPAYYMLLVPYINEKRRTEIPAVTHVDGSGRVQTVSSKLNPKLHRLLAAFHEQTGTPVLLNTSFNDNGEPIVESPNDAISCFLNIDLNYLVLDDYILKKTG